MLTIVVMPNGKSKTDADAPTATNEKADASRAAKVFKVQIKGVKP